MSVPDPLSTDGAKKVGERKNARNNIAATVAREAVATVECRLDFVSSFTRIVRGLHVPQHTF
jgi:hypothetical protein